MKKQKGAMNMIYFPESWKRKMQKKMKEHGFNMAYKKDIAEFEVFTSKARTKKGLQIRWINHHLVPKILLKLDKRFFEKVDGEVKERYVPLKVVEVLKFALEDVIKQIIEVNESAQKKYKLEFLVETHWAIGLEEKERVRDLLAFFNFKEMPNKPMRFLDSKTYSFYESAYETLKVFEKEFEDRAWKPEDNDVTWFDLKHEDAPYRFKMSINGNAVDRKMAVDINYDEACFKVSMWSPYHSKNQTYDSLSIEKLKAFHEGFLEEERYKELFAKPQMNNTIEGFLYRIEKIDSVVKKDDLFEFLCQSFSVKEMTDKCKDFNKSERIKKRELSDMYEEDRYVGEPYGETKRYRSCTIKIWDKYLNVYCEIKKYAKYENISFSIFDTLEEAIKEEVEWARELI